MQPDKCTEKKKIRPENNTDRRKNNLLTSLQGCFSSRSGERESITPVMLEEGYPVSFYFFLLLW